ncbi:phenylalanine--tRNA ligase subunit alpha [Anoxynatronum buryatiense]|uniref:Phenylalanine--tRNA ligase alpha subunit n=1 Tax=Anoxynatronum buryatiense TaxID=489973 RepID=A0AA45WTD1_9CLOT|nr:phenylalanine--tRNA ligase subunit alpha [Anoxynatronum buryatiense]SMP40693.1 phenylalanyl-tRNA synthetase, alpha subunit [Anoxynatronum buryatiense]
MEKNLKQLEIEAREVLQAARDAKELENLRVKYLGKKGSLTELLRSMGSLPKEERPRMGQVANEVREAVEAAMNAARDRIGRLEMEARIARETIDITMPGKVFSQGTKHPLTQTLDELKEVFIGMGFTVAEGPEVETVVNNFDMLNAPANHPSREMTDTFYINEQVILRPQTSPVQVRVMKSTKPPIRIIAPGRCFRNDTPDATHSPMFNQLEGLVVDKGSTLGDLKGSLEIFARHLFGEHTQIKFRPHYFPFTEPSAEVDVTCFKCQGEGCSVCKGSGWIELLGAGMVHPNVLRNCGIDPETYSGWAFGMGIDRIAMQKYGIDDIRLLYENDLRFLSQF